MAVRTVTAAAALAAAVAVYALVRRDRRLRRQVARERAAGRLTAGCLTRDLEVFRRRLNEAIAQHAVVAAAGLVLDDALSDRHRIDPHNTEGGPQ